MSLFKLSSYFQRCGIASSASPEASEKQNRTNAENNGESAKTNGDAKVSEQTESEVADQTKESGSMSESQSTMSQTAKRRRGGTKRTAFSDSDSEEESLTVDDLVKLVAEKEELLELKHKEIEKMQDKVLRSYAEMENVMDRTRRESENSKKFAIQVSLMTSFLPYVFVCFVQCNFLFQVLKLIGCLILCCRVLQRVCLMLQTT